MARPGSRRAEHVQPEKPVRETTSAGPAAPPPSAEPAPARTGLAWYWRLVLFLWTTSFFFLLLYEILSALFRMF